MIETIIVTKLTDTAYAKTKTEEKLTDTELVSVNSWPLSVSFVAGLCDTVA